MPEPIDTGLMLESGEVAYWSIASTWMQTRVHTHGYAGGSVSVPTGISGVRFRFGGYSPVRSEEITPLSSGLLIVTNTRLVFSGSTRNTKSDLKKISDAHVYSDCVRIDKFTGKPDYFSMTAPEARWVVLLIEKLRGA